MAKISLYWRATRPWSFTVSVMPPILGAIIAVSENPDLSFHWWYFILTLVGCVLAHAAANALSDYFDFKVGVDRQGTYGSSGVLVEQSMKPAELLRFASFLYLVAGIIAAYLIVTIPKGMFLFWLVLIGFILGAFYTMAPFKFKYRAMGDVAVFIAFGSAMTLGAYFVQAQHFSWSPILFALPMALLVIAILHSNNLRDIANDAVVNIRTIPILIGESRAKALYYIFLIGAYILIPILVIFAALPWLSLLTVISLPLALKAIKMVQEKNIMPPEKFAMIDAMTAQLHMVFSLLFIISFSAAIIFLQ